MIKVREPSIDDFREILTLATWFQENSPYFAGIPLEPRKVFDLLATSLLPDGAIFVNVTEKDGKIIGMFAGSVTEYFFSKEKIATDIALVFYPDSRKDIYGAMKQMVSNFEDWAKANGSREICIANAAGLAGESLNKFLERQGYVPKGFIFKKGA
jgi:hypothetical protein